jgi:putative transcriptional regulator
VVASPEPGKSLRAWREKLGIRQVSLARELKVSPSVLSDYESGRRPSPGVVFVRRYIDALVRLDEAKGRVVSKLVSHENNSAILSIGEFPVPVLASKLLEAVKGDVVVANTLDIKLYGYTVVDSIKTIYALSGYDFYRIFGATTERAIVFTKVGLGRSPLVAIRVSQLKPRMVVLHGPKEIDPLAVELARKEGIILAVSRVQREELVIESLKAL